MSTSYLSAAADVLTLAPGRRCSAVFLVCAPDEASYTGGDDIDYQLHLVELETDVLGWFNGLWDASRGSAARECYVDAGLRYIQATLGRHVGDTLKERALLDELAESSGVELELGAVCGACRLDDLCRVEGGRLNGIPPQPLSAMDELGAWVAGHMFCEGAVLASDYGLYWTNTMDFDSAYALLDLGHSEAALRACLRLFGDHVDVASDGATVSLRHQRFRGPA